jgi:hypothetical protein
MGKQVTIDDDVINELVKRVFELDLVVRSVIETTSEVLKMTKKGTSVKAPSLLSPTFPNISPLSNTNSDNYPSSKVLEIQKLLDGLRDTIFNISKDGMKLKHKKWVADPNVVTITVQDARAKNLRNTVYGRPSEFESIKGSLEIKDDMAGYSRFVIDNVDQLVPAVNVIEHSYKLKNERGRIK